MSQEEGEAMAEYSGKITILYSPFLLFLSRMRSALPGVMYTRMQMRRRVTLYLIPTSFCN